MHLFISRRRPPALFPLLLVLAVAIAPFTGHDAVQAQGTEPGANPSRGTDSGLVVYLVRHAEKVDDSRDPELTEAGKERAALLAHMLVDSGVQAIYSTDYIRTRDTAAPLAEELEIGMEFYEPVSLDALQAFADELRSRGGRALVSGHSNTTPALVAALGGDPGEPITEDEYDRLYIVTVAPDGLVSTVLLRYGQP